MLDLTAPPLPPAYRPLTGQQVGAFLVLEGVACTGKSTLASILAEQWHCPRFHTSPDPMTALQPFVNAQVKPLPHLAFYLTGALHVSDLAREALLRGPVIADRYIASVIANHAAVHRLSNEDARQATLPFLRYLIRPDITVYLHATAAELMERERERANHPGSRPAALSTDLIDRLQARFDEIAADDPTAMHIYTDGRWPKEIAREINGKLAALSGH